MYIQTGGWMESVNGLPVRKRSVSTYSSPFDPIGYVFHYTVGCGSDLSSVFQSRSVSTHFSVSLEGEVFQYVPMTGKAWHADNANPRYWGVEHTAMPGTCELNDKQLEASVKLTAALVEYTKAHWGRDIPLKKIQGSDLIPGFHDHRDGNGVDWNFNRHTDHLYRWTWDKYLVAVADVTNNGGSEDMALSDLEQGSKDFRNGVALGDNWNKDRVFGWNLEKRIANAASTPVPGSVAPHAHNYSIPAVNSTTDAA